MQCAWICGCLEGQKYMWLKELSSNKNNSGMSQDDPGNSQLSLAILPPSTLKDEHTPSKDHGGW